MSGILPRVKAGFRNSAIISSCETPAAGAGEPACRSLLEVAQHPPVKKRSTDRDRAPPQTWQPVRDRSAAIEHLQTTERSSVPSPTASAAHQRLDLARKVTRADDRGGSLTAS